MPTKKSHGGRRAGAGRKPILEEPYKFSFVLERSTFEELVGFAEDEDLPVGVYVRRTLAQHVARRQRTRRSR